MNAAGEPLEQAMYVASRDDRLWLQNVQRKLYERSRENRTTCSRSCGGL